MGVIDKLKSYYKILPIQAVIVNNKAANIAEKIYNVAVENNTFKDDEKFNPDYASKIKKYIIYYDIGKSQLPVCDVKINHTTLENEMLANRNTMRIFEETFKVSELSKEEQICKDILFDATQRNEQFDGMGFPRCIAGENISPIGRILAVSHYIARKLIDCVDEKSLIQRLRIRSGKKFDPAVVDLAMLIIGELYTDAKQGLFPVVPEDFRSIQVVYQPIVDATNDTMKYNEAFLCINDSKQGIVMPQIFQTVAEKNNKIMDITKYGFEILCRNIAAIKYADEKFPRIFFVNISSACLSKPTFLNFVKKMIKTFEINPQRLVFEFDVAFTNITDFKFKNLLNQYKEMGIRFAVDHYGIDNSSFTKLEEFDFDFIKIDKSFVDKVCTNKKTYEIVKNILKMADGLNLEVIANGVEIQQQKEFLLQINCIYMQGRLFGQPEYLSI